MLIVTAISKECISSLSLPQKITGQYWLFDGYTNNNDHLISIEGINEEWVLKSNRRVKIVDQDGITYKSVIISPSNMYILVDEAGLKTIVYVEPATSDREIFSKYLINRDAELTIGRDLRNDISFDIRSVSSIHAILKYRRGDWILKDNNSTNGTFVNGKRVEEVKLYPGDTIFIMGLKIIIGKEFLAINNPDGKVKVPVFFQKYIKQPVVTPEDDEEEYEIEEKSSFYRSPRFKRDVEIAKIKVDGPTTSPVSEEAPWIMVMGSSLTMGMMSFVTLGSAIAMHNYTSVAMGISMLTGTILMPVITKKYEKKRKKQKEELRQKKYREYLNDVTARIQEANAQQVEILNENVITIKECEERINNVQRNLWERTIDHNDFMRVRIGHGNSPMELELTYQERRFLIDSDNLQEEMYTLCEKPQVLHNIPISFSLLDHFVSGVIGPRSEVIRFAKGLMIQQSALYSYDEVKFIVLYDKKEEKEFEFIKWLPHVWNDEFRFRFVATNESEIKEVSAFFEEVINQRSQMNDNDLAEETPYYLIFSLSKSLAGRAEMIKQILSHKENLHFSFVALYNEFRDLPKECSMVVELDGKRGLLFDKNDISGKHIEFIPDIYPSTEPLVLSKKLANVSLNSAADKYKLPSMITFLELFGVGKVEHLNSLTRWRENDPTKSLEAEVGVDTLGEKFKLDLHEKFHGPHGLVAGMTGSGKSEFIITYILSMAVNYHPNEVAFILIDYKGGGMAKSFEKLPHTAGIITNLDGAAIKRSLVSIESELKRRQAIFAQVSKDAGVSNIDIYKYQKLYREGTVSEPLQHLFIISDEFAELKTQQPEFMAQLVSAARIGRSLGVHLILATQKPSGVVDDQIWSNSKFRVCLKVQERADSMDMLKRPDAAELTDTGRFYLQVGYNELFELGQSAWAGALYYPSDKVYKEKDNSIEVIDLNGHIIKQAKIDRKRSLYNNAPKQLDEITKYLQRIAEEEKIKIRPLWLDPIAPIIYLDDIREKYSVTSEKYCLNPVIGEYDDPVHQQQCVLRLPISEEGNAIIYGAAGSGKTSFLFALMMSLMKEHTPEEVNIYALDFGAETLKAFARSPHIGDVILSHESEKVNQMFKMLMQEMNNRKRLVSDFGGDIKSYIKNSGEGIPSIVVIIHNFAAFSELYSDSEEIVSLLSREGIKYGIYFILTSVGTNGVRFRLLQNFKQLLVLQLNDETEYSGIVGKTDGLYPSKYKGRGLIRLDSLYEFQIASIAKNQEAFTYVQGICSELNDNWKGKRARKTPILPDVVDADFLKGYIIDNKSWKIPIGVEKNSLMVHYYPFGENCLNLITSGNDEYKPFVSKLSDYLGNTVGVSGIVLDIGNSASFTEGALKHVTTAQGCNDAVSELFEIVLKRNHMVVEAKESNQKCEALPPFLVIINSLSMLKQSLGEQECEKLTVLLEKNTTEYNVIVIFTDRVKDISTYAYDKWYKSNFSNAYGIWVGGGINEQYILKPSRLSSEMRMELPAGFGIVIERGKAVLVKLIGDQSGEFNYAE